MKQLGDEYKIAGGNQEIYSDFLHTFLPHPNTKQITRKTNEESVKMALRNLIFTNKYERPRKPAFGGNIRNYLFEPFTPLIENNIKKDLENLIRNEEPRVRVNTIRVSAMPDDNGLIISIVFRMVTTQTPQQVDISLYRVR